MALLDLAGDVVVVNGAWDAFGLQNGQREGYSALGVNYLQVCEFAIERGSSETASVVETLAGLLSVLQAGLPSYSKIYPCHSPTEQRWYKLRAQRMTPEVPAILISHSRVDVPPVQTAAA